VLATAIGISTLNRFGIDAEALPVGVRLLNPAAVKLVDEGSPGGVDEGLRRGAYMLTNLDPAPLRQNIPGRVWSRHLVMLVPSRECVIDLDFQQLNRPEQDIVVPPAIMLSWPAGHADCCWTTTTGARLYFKAEPHNRTYQQATDWRVFPDIVACVERAIRKGE
jgi:hypothetical protein